MSGSVDEVGSRKHNQVVSIYFIRNTHSLTFASLNFSFSKFSSPPSTLFVSSPYTPSFSTVLSFCFCSFEHVGDDDVKHSVLVVESGLIELDNVKVIHQPMISLSEGVDWFVVDMSNVEVMITESAIEGMSFSGGSVISGSGNMKTKNERSVKDENLIHTLSMNNVNITNVSGTDKACVIEGRKVGEMKLIWENVILKTCKSVESVKGGGMILLLSKNCELTLKGSSYKECVVGSKYVEDPGMNMHLKMNDVEGRGGGICLDGVGSGSVVFSLEFLLMNMSFAMNEAFRGRDVYVYCVDILSQVNETQFQFDFREGKYNRTYAIWGNDESGIEKDLMSLIVTHQDDTIYVCGEKKDSGNEKICGTKDLPCSSLVNGLSHLIMEEESRLFVDGWISIYSRVSLSRVSVKGRNGIGSFMCEGGLMKKGERVLMILNEKVHFEMINFRFEKYEGDKNGEIFIESEGEVLFSNCSIGQSETEFRDELWMIFLSMVNGKMKIDTMTVSCIDNDLL
jgi:hypothetical protein